MGKPIRDSKGKFAGSEGEGKKKVPTAGTGKPSTASATEVTSTTVDYDSQYSRFSTTSTAAPDWGPATYDDDGHITLSNPHESLDGFIDVQQDDDGRYVASVHEFQDDAGDRVEEIDSEEFDTLEEAKRWAENWRQ